MSKRKLTVAVTGLNATENPGPGVSVIRAIRRDTELDLRVVGLAYDAMEPGLYAHDVIDDAFLLPYPSEGAEALDGRLRYIHERVPLDVIIPTLDSELPSFIALESTLKDLGIGTFLPTREQFDLRSKVNLTTMGKKTEIPVPQARTIVDVNDLYAVHQDLPYPFYVKGLYYGAQLARSIDEAINAFHRIVASWGLPVIVQEALDGDEFDIVCVGDGNGGLVGAVPMKKTYLTDKGKGWAGITVKDPQLLQLAEQFAHFTQWRGPCELELIKTTKGEYFLLEVNPRFPAWSFLSAGAGINLPAATARLAAGETVSPMREFRAGTMFTRISLDLITELSDFQQLTTTGELVRSGSNHNG